MKAKLFVCLIFISILSSLAFAEMYISLPKIAEIETVNVEKGATPKIAIKYKNNTGASVNIDAIVIHLTFNKSLIDNIVSIKNANGRQLGEDGGPMLDTVNGEIVYKLKKVYNSLSVAAGQTIDLAYITFHLTQPLSQFMQPYQQFTILQGQQLFFWSTAAPFNLVRNQMTQADVKGTTFNQPNIYLRGSAPPNIPPASWNSVMQATYSGNQFGKKDIGNTLVINWASVGNLSLSGNNAIDFTPFNNRRLSYRLFRNELDLFGPGSGAIELHEFEPLPDDEPANRAPWTGNIPNVPYLYQDGPGTGVPGISNPLSDGKKYYFRLEACDACLPNSNFVASASFSQVPVDLTPPAEISKNSLTAVPDDGVITLEWENPKDEDFGGVIILRTIGDKNPIEPVDLGSASPGPSYLDGPNYSDPNRVYTEPFPGKGTIVFIGGPGDTRYDDNYDPDNQLGNGLINSRVYNYRLYTFDVADPSPPRQMGFNYSKVGIAVSRIPGKPPEPISDFTVSETQNIGEVKITWTDSPNGASTMIRYSYVGFKDLKDESSGELLNIYPTYGGPQEMIEYLDTRYPLYFKAFAVNQTDQELDPKDPVNMAKHLFSSGVTASLNALTGKIATYTYDFKPGINYFAIPFPAPNLTDSKDKTIDISTMSKLVDAINAQAGGNVVRTLGRWDAAKQKAVGIININYGKTDKFMTTQNFSANGPVNQGEALVVTVSKPFTFTLKSSIVQ